MDDLISRQAAIDAVNDVIADYIPNIYGRYEALPLEIASAVNRLPSAQLTAEPVRHGKWIGYAGTIGNECSVCGKWIDVLQGTAEMNYCPNCGCRMDAE